MQKSTKAKIVGGATAIVMACGLAVAGSSLTSAYFSDTNTGGAITASFGSIFVDVDGEEVTTPNVDLADILPGETRTGTFTVENTGRSAQDVWLSFDSNFVLGLINNLGRTAAIEITVDGQQVFYSGNLNDDPEDQGMEDIMPLPKELLLKSGVEAEGTFEVGFSFTLSEGSTTQIGLPLSLPYSIVATQVGIAPGA